MLWDFFVGHPKNPTFFQEGFLGVQKVVGILGSSDPVKGERWGSLDSWIKIQNQL